MLIVKRYKRSPKIAGCEVTHNFSFSHRANLLHPGFWGVRRDTWPADTRAFSRPTHFLREKPWGRGWLVVCFHDLAIPQFKARLEDFIQFTQHFLFSLPPVALLDQGKCPESHASQLFVSPAKEIFLNSSESCTLLLPWQSFHSWLLLHLWL